MAKINYNEIVDEQSFNDGIKNLIQQFSKLESVLKGLATTAGSALKPLKYNDSNDLKAHEQAVNDIATATKGLNEIEKQKILLDKQLKEGTDENVKAKIRYSNAAKEQRDILKYELQVAQNAEGSYAKLSAQYALNKIALNKMSEAQRSGTEEGRKLEASTNEIYQSMKKLQEATGKHVLSVGDYGIATKSLRLEMRETKEELTRLIQAGASMSDKRVIELSKKYDDLQDAMTKAKNAANLSDKAGMFIGFTKTIATMSAGFQVAQGAAALFGKENENLQKTMLKIQALLSITHGLEVIANNLRKEGAVITFLQVSAEKLRVFWLNLTNKSIETNTKNVAANTVAEEANVVSTNLDTESKIANASATSKGAANVSALTSKTTILTGATRGLGGSFAVVGILLAGFIAGILAVKKQYEELTAAHKKWSDALNDLKSSQAWIDNLDKISEKIASIELDYKKATGEMTEDAYNAAKDTKEINENFQDEEQAAWNLYWTKKLEAEKAYAVEKKFLEGTTNATSTENQQKAYDEWSLGASVQAAKTLDAATINKEKLLTLETAYNNKMTELLTAYTDVKSKILDAEAKAEKVKEEERTKIKLAAQQSAYDKYLSAYKTWLRKIQDMQDEMISNEESTTAKQEEEDIAKNTRKRERDLEDLKETVLTATQKAEMELNIVAYYNDLQLQIQEKYYKARQSKAKEQRKIEYDQMVQAMEEELKYRQSIDKLTYLETMKIGEEEDELKANQNEFELKQLQEQYEALNKESETYAQDEIDLAIKIKEKKIEIAQGEYDALKALMDKDIEEEKKLLEEKKKNEDELLDAVTDTSEKIINSYIERSKAKQDSINDEIDASKEYEDQLRELAKQGIENSDSNLAYEQRKQAELEKKKERELKKQKRLELGLAAVTAFGKLAESDEKTALAKTITEITELMAFINSIPEYEDGVIALYGRRKTSAPDDTIAKIGPGESVMTAPATDKYYDQLKDMQSLKYDPLDYIDMPRFTNYNESSIEKQLGKKIDNLTDVVKNKPEYQIDIDALTGEIVERITRGNTVTINKYKRPFLR